MTISPLNCFAIENLSLSESLAYNLLLLVVTTMSYFAFHTWKTPEKFNEAKFISLIVYTLCVLWLALCIQVSTFVSLVMHQSKENLGPIVPFFSPTCWPANSLPTISIVQPHMIWSMQHQYGTQHPHLRKDQDLLESTQKFACKMMTKTWTEAMITILFSTWHCCT